jgi:hypothetical protein
MGFMELAINLTYENKEMQEFPFAHIVSANFYSDSGSWDMPNWGDEDWGNDFWDFEEESGFPWWIVILSGSLLLAAGIVVIIIVARKNKKARTEDDDIDYFLSQLNVGSAAPVQPSAQETNEEIMQ